MIVILLLLATVMMLVGYSVYILWRDQYSSKAKTFAQRIDTIGKGKVVPAPDMSILKQVKRPDRAGFAKTGVLANIDWSLQHAGLSWSLNRFGLYTAIGALVGAVMSGLLGLPIGVCAVLLCIGAAVPYSIVRYLSRRRSAKMEKQLPDVLDMMASMLRAGHALLPTLALLAEEIPKPIGDEFRLLHGEITYGSSTEDAMNHLVERTRSEDIRCLVMAILIQRETGGNLTDILGSLSSVTRERMKLHGKIRGLSAEGRLSAWVLTILPCLVATLIYFIMPDYLSLFWTDQTGIKMLYTMVVMLVVGQIWMQRTVKIRV